MPTRDDGSAQEGPAQGLDAARLDHIAIRASLAALTAALAGATAMARADGSQPVMIWLAVLVPHVVLVLAGVAAFAWRDRTGWAWLVRIVVLWPVLLLVGFLGYAAVLAFDGTGWSMAAGTLFLVAVAIPAALLVFGLVWPIAASLHRHGRPVDLRAAGHDPDVWPLT